MSKVLRLPQNLHFEVKVEFGPKHEVSLASATKSDHRVTKRRTPAQREPATGPQISRACAVEMQHECTANSSELAVHARAPQRSKHSCLTIDYYRKNR